MKKLDNITVQISKMTGGAGKYTDAISLRIEDQDSGRILADVEIPEDQAKFLFFKSVARGRGQFFLHADHGKKREVKQVTLTNIANPPYEQHESAMIAIKAIAETEYPGWKCNEYDWSDKRYDITAGTYEVTMIRFV